MEEERLEVIKLRAMSLMPSGIFDADISRHEVTPMLNHAGELLFESMDGYLRCDAKVLGKVENYDIAIPATWWDHFKLDVMPDWFTNIFPVSYETNQVVIRRWTVYYSRYCGKHVLHLCQIDGGGQ